MCPRLRELLAEKSANVAITAALAILPLTMVAGLAIDFQLAVTRKAQVQAALDNAVLSASKSMQIGRPQDEVIAETRQYVEAVLSQNSGAGLNCEPAAVSYADDTEELRASIRCEQSTTLSQILGQNYVSFDVDASASYGLGKLEVAFVFDVSGSMGSAGRMASLKTAASEAVDILLPTEGYTGDPEDIRLAMVSYDTMVNAGPYFKAVTNVEPTRTFSYYGSVQMCTRMVPNGPERQHCYTPTSGGHDGTPVTVTGPLTCYWYQPQRCEYEWVSDQTRTTTLTSTCVWEREGSERYTNAAPGSGRWLTPVTLSFVASGNYWWGNASCNSDVPVPLTNDRSKLLNFINGMRPRGSTAGHIGTAWGWYLVSPEWNHVWPAESAAFGYDEPDVTKVVILMSDGAYNQVRPGSSNPSSDTQARALCDQMKASGIMIYTIGFNAPASGQAVLDYCASAPAFSFRPTTGQQLTENYKLIARDISDLRISR